MELKGKTIVITGAARGLGRSMAVRLAGCGARTALLDVNEEGLAQTREQCELAGPPSQCYTVDLTDESQSAAKAGVAGRTFTCAKELARHNIRVGAIAPGFCRTTLVEQKPT